MVLAIHRKKHNVNILNRHVPDSSQLILGTSVMIKEGRPRGLALKDMESVAFVIFLSFFDRDRK